MPAPNPAPRNVAGETLLAIASLNFSPEVNGLPLWARSGNKKERFLSTLAFPVCSFIPAVGDDVCDWVLEEGGGEFASEACAIAGTCPASEATIRSEERRVGKECRSR